MRLPKELEDMVRSRAHEIYVERSGRGLPGTAEADWLEAEEHLSPSLEALLEMEASVGPAFQQKLAILKAELARGPSAAEES